MQKKGLHQCRIKKEKNEHLHTALGQWEHSGRWLPYRSSDEAVCGMHRDLPMKYNQISFPTGTIQYNFFAHSFFLGPKLLATDVQQLVVVSLRVERKHTAHAQMPSYVMSRRLVGWGA